MGYSKNLEKLQQRMLDFHQALMDAKAYRVHPTIAEFLALTNRKIEDTARNLFDNDGDPWLKVLHLPHYLLYDLAKILRLVYWDTEDVAPDLFMRLEEVFRQTPFQFQWIFDEEQQRLNFTIDTYSWSVGCEHLDQEELWVDPFHFTQLDPNLMGYLRSQGWYLYIPTGFDQIMQLMLVALPAVEHLKRYLIPCFDPREEWFHQGIPETDRPESVWML